MDSLLKRLEEEGKISLLTEEDLEAIRASIGIQKPGKVLVDVEKLREMLLAIKNPIPRDIPRDQHINTLLCGIEDWIGNTLKENHVS